MEAGKYDLVTVLGHTAGGKTAFAARLADRIGGEIISADSRQVYRGMDIGTGKDYDDYLVDGRSVPVHLIDHIEAGREYNVYLFKQDFFRVYNDLAHRAVTPVLCGGTGLYIESVLRNYRMLHVPVNNQLREDLESRSFGELEGMLKLYGSLHNVTDTVNRKRLVRAIEIAMYQSAHQDRTVGGEQEQSLRSKVLGISFQRTVRRQRITRRLMERLDNGMVEEVERLLESGIPSRKMDYYGLEYRYVNQYIQKEITYDEMVERLNIAIHQFAKRQMTYFRGMERRGIPIHWIEGSLPMEEKLERAMEVLAT